MDFPSSITGLGHRIEHHLQGAVEERDVGSLECQAPAKGRNETCTSWKEW